MEEAFGKILERIFNNWFALKLAVDHSMGGPNSKQTAIDCMNYMVQYCLYENDIDVYMIQKTLEDIMDEKFDTICEDESPKEIATILFRFVQLMKDGNLQQCEEEFQKLPTMNDNWINTLSHAKQNETDSSSSSEDDQDSNAPAETPMQEDEGWTQVKTKSRKKR